jgi:hypothetical protein
MPAGVLSGLKKSTSHFGCFQLFVVFFYPCHNEALNTHDEAEKNEEGLACDISPLLFLKRTKVANARNKKRVCRKKKMRGWLVPQKVIRYTSRPVEKII